MSPQHPRHPCLLLIWMYFGGAALNKPWLQRPQAAEMLHQFPRCAAALFRGLSRSAWLGIPRPRARKSPEITTRFTRSIENHLNIPIKISNPQKSSKLSSWKWNPPWSPPQPIPPGGSQLMVISGSSTMSACRAASPACSAMKPEWRPILDVNGKLWPLQVPKRSKNLWSYRPTGGISKSHILEVSRLKLSPEIETL